MDSQELQQIKNRYDIVGGDPSIDRAIETAVAIAPTDLAVLVSGESGVGKDVIPRVIHQFSHRKTGKFLAINCGAIPEGTISAELFGNEKGAYTGAVSERKGYFEEADGGTLFLDEIGELPRDTQAHLLRVLQNGEFVKVGSSKVQKTDVRVIAATNVDLRNAVAKGTFREDLYYRLNAVQIDVPSLRERKDDIYLMFRKFSADFSEKYSLRKISLTHEAISALKAYRWPGNVRQLKNVCETITALESRPITPGSDLQRIELDADVISKYIPDEKDTLIPAISTVGGERKSGFSDEEKLALAKALNLMKAEVENLKERVENLEKKSGSLEDKTPDEPEWQGEDVVEAPTVLNIKKNTQDMIQQALEKHKGNVKAAAAELGVSERTIYRKIKK